MKRIINTAIVYFIFAMAGGVFYREFTKWNGYTEPRIWTDIDCDWATTQRVRWDLAFGKTVFLTREEAEAALRREQE